MICFKYDSLDFLFKMQAFCSTDSKHLVSTFVPKYCFEMSECACKKK